MAKGQEKTKKYLKGLDKSGHIEGLRVSWSPDLLLKSRLRRALAKLCEGKGENSCFIEIAFLEKETISHAQCAFYIDKHRKGRLLRENSFCLKKTFSFIRFFFFSFFL